MTASAHAASGRIASMDVGSAMGMIGYVLNGGTKYGTVGNDETAIVERIQLDREQLTLVHLAEVTGDLNHVANFEWPKHQEHHARSEVP